MQNLFLLEMERIGYRIGRSGGEMWYYRASTGGNPAEI